MTTRLRAALRPGTRLGAVGEIYLQVLAALSTADLAVSEVAALVRADARRVRGAIDAARRAGVRVSRRPGGRFHLGG